MYEVTKYPHGTFCWADCVSTDSDRAKQFYIDLMGWNHAEIQITDGTVYTVFKVGDKHVTALSQMMPDMQAKGIPSHWHNYIAVDDVDALAGKVTELGGTVVMPPFDVMDSGRQMVIQDPTGAIVSLWQAKNLIGAQLVNTTGAMGWNELSTRDPQAATDFFSKLLGWTFQKQPDADYWAILNNGRMNGGIIKMTDAWGDAPPSWTVYFSVADINAAAARVTELGGTIHIPPTEIPQGHFLVMGEPTGAISYLIKAHHNDPWIE